MRGWKSYFENHLILTGDMKAKNNSKSEPLKSTPFRRKPRTSKGVYSQKSEFIASFGKDAESIRKEVLRVKEKQKKRPNMLEQLGDCDLLK